jgi:hypothetical protein
MHFLVGATAAMFPTVSLHDVFRLAIVRVSVAIRTLTGRLLPRFGFNKRNLSPFRRQLLSVLE